MTDAQIVIEYAYNILYPQGNYDEVSMTADEVANACGNANIEYMKKYLIDLYGEEIFK